MMTKLRGFLKKNTNCTRHIKMILAQYPRKQTIATFVKQDSWLRMKTDEIQSFADRKDLKKFHDALKTIYGPKTVGATTLLSADGSTLLTDKNGISRQRSGKGAIRKRFPLQKPRWEKNKPTIRHLYHETYRKPNEQLFSQ